MKNEYLDDALTLEAEGFYAEALPAYDEAMKLNRRNATIPFHKGTVLSQLGRYEEALENYDKAITLDRKRAAIYHRRAEALFHLKQYDMAQESAQKCLELEGEKYQTIYNDMLELFAEAKVRDARSVKETSS